MASQSPGDHLQTYVEEMLTWVRGKGKILIVVHDNPDPDCFASAMALNHLFVMKLNKEAVLSFSGMIGRSENLAMAKHLQIPLTPLAILDINDFQVICMIDTQPGFGNNSLPPGIKVDILIDHHPQKDPDLSCRFMDIRPDYGVTATILYEYLQAEDLPIGTKLATALFYAIKSETQDLGREANRPDREAYHKLFPFTNKLLLYEICHPKLPIEYFEAFHNALEHTIIYNNVLIANLQVVVFPEIVAELADFLLRLEGIDIVLCMGHYNNEMDLSMRTVRHDINVGEIIKLLVAGIGSAGGHGMMAGGKLENIPPVIDEILKVEALLTRRLLRVMEVNAEPEKLVRSAPMKGLPKTG